MTSRDIGIELPDGAMLPAFFAPAKAVGPVAGIVLLQEIFGVNANIRQIAEDYASRGFNVIAPDFFWRQQAGVQLDPVNPADRERATELMKGLDQPLAVQDGLAAAAYLRKLDGASGKVGAVGYCLGGKLAYLLAAQAGIDAAVSYYGVAIQSALDKAGDVQSPLLLHIAGEDHLCPPEAQAAIEQAMSMLPNVTVTTYPGAGHAFARRGGAGFDANAADRADRATFDFFERTLKSAG